MQDNPTIHPLCGSIQEVFATPETQRFRVFPSARQNPRGKASTPGTTQAQRRLVIWHAGQCCIAILVGAVLALAIHDAPAKIAATVLKAQQEEGW